MDSEQEYANMLKQLEADNYFNTPRNNKLVLEFFKAKLNGGYGRIIFEKTVNSKGTLTKKAMNLRKFMKYFDKDFELITQEELLEFRDKLNTDKIMASKTLTVYDRVTKKHSFKIIETNRPLSYPTKRDYASNFNEFYKFVREYNYQEKINEIKEKIKNIKDKKKQKEMESKLKSEIEELPEITKYFKVKRPSNFEEIKVEFIDDDERQTLLSNIKNRKFKAYVQQALMSGARPCEMLEIRYGKQHNLYKNKEGKWVIKLPRIKGVSYKKFPFVIDMFEDELIPFYESLNLKDGDLVFKTTPQTVRKLMHHYTSKYLKKSYSPKILRKTARMIRTNAGYSEQWCNKLLGHSPSSKIADHYINLGGIKNEPIANEKMKAQQYPSLKRDYQKMQMQLKAQQEQMAEMNKVVQAIMNKEKISKLK